MRRTDGVAETDRYSSICHPEEREDNAGRTDVRICKSAPKSTYRRRKEGREAKIALNVFSVVVVIDPITFALLNTTQNSLPVHITVLYIYSSK